MRIKTVVGNCVKCGAPIYDEATIEKADRSVFSPNQNHYKDYNGKPEASCYCLNGILKLTV